jgi:hypothetical protein
MHARAADAGEVQVEALGTGRLKLRRYEFHLRIERVHLRQRAFPIGVEVRGPRVDALVRLELVEREIEGERHKDSCLW